MANSLQEQLLKSGLASSAKEREIRSGKRKQQKQQKQTKSAAPDEVRRLALQAQREKAENDRRLNQLKQAELEQRQITAQIRQLIDVNKLKQVNDGIEYHFTDGNKVKTVYVEQEVRNGIIKGRLAIVKCDKQYQVVPVDVAGKIMERDESYIVVLNKENKENSTDDDPYSAYQVPDDLMW